MRRAAADRRLRHPRQDDDRRDARLGPARAGRRPRRSSSAASFPAPAPARSRRTPAGGRASGSSPRPTSRDGSFLELRPEVAVVTNVELDHHSHWGSRGRADRGLLALRGARRGPGAVLTRRWTRRRSQRTSPEPSGTRRAFDRPSEPGPRRSALAVPGRHNLLNARAALRRARAGRLRPRRRGGRGAGGFPGVLRRLERKGSRNGAVIYDDYAHHPTEVAAALAGAARARAAAPDRRLPAAPVLADQGARPGASARRSRAADEIGGARRLSGARASRSGQLAGVSGARRRPRPPPIAPAGDRSGGSRDATTRRARARATGSARATCWSRSAPATSTSSREPAGRRRAARA